jgi:hypothetical protein
MAGILWGIQGDTMGIKWDVTEYHGYLTENHGIEWWIISDHIWYPMVFFSWDITEYNGISWIAWVVMEIYLMNITDHFMEWGYHV